MKRSTRAVLSHFLINQVKNVNQYSACASLRSAL
jgi:hypothetical protein